MIRKSPVFTAKADAFGPQEHRVLQAVRSILRAEYLLDSTDAHRRVLAAAKYTNEEIERDPARSEHAVTLIVEALLGFAVEQGLVAAGARLSPFERADRERFEAILAAYKRVPDPAQEARDEVAQAESRLKTKKEQFFAAQSESAWALRDVEQLRAALVTAEKHLAAVEAAEAAAKAAFEAEEAALPERVHRRAVLEAGEQQLEREELAALEARKQEKVAREKEEARQRDESQRRALEAECRHDEAERRARQKAQAEATAALVAAAERAKGKK